VGGPEGSQKARQINTFSGLPDLHLSSNYSTPEGLFSGIPAAPK
jgi:hypothetical protein